MHVLSFITFPDHQNPQNLYSGKFLIVFSTREFMCWWTRLREFTFYKWSILISLRCIIFKWKCCMFTFIFNVHRKYSCERKSFGWEFHTVSLIWLLCRSNWRKLWKRSDRIQFRLVSCSDVMKMWDCQRKLLRTGGAQSDMRTTCYVSVTLLKREPVCK